MIKLGFTFAQVENKMSASKSGQQKNILKIFQKVSKVFWFTKKHVSSIFLTLFLAALWCFLLKNNKEDFVGYFTK